MNDYAVKSQTSQPAPSVAVLDVIRNRRSVRDYTPEPVRRDILQQLIETACLAPSAMNEQPWHFTIVTDRGLMDRIASDGKAYMLFSGARREGHSGFAASLLRDDAFHIFYHAPALAVISAPSQAHWAVEDCALAAQNLMLAAYAIGLGTCWIGFAQAWLQSAEGKRSIGLPDGLLPIAPIIVGHPARIAPTAPRRAPTVRWIP